MTPSQLRVVVHFRCGGDVPFGRDPTHKLLRYGWYRAGTSHPKPNQSIANVYVMQCSPSKCPPEKLKTLWGVSDWEGWVPPQHTARTLRGWWRPSVGSIGGRRLAPAVPTTASIGTWTTMLASWHTPRHWSPLGRRWHSWRAWHRMEYVVLVSGKINVRLT